MTRDYYDILGVSRNADDAAIKKAYRRLAKKFHPDVNNEPEAKTRFAEVQEAYDVLSDKTKRQRYDQFGHAGVHAGAGAEGGGFGGGWRQTNTGPGGFSFRGGEGVDPSQFEDLFSQFFGHGGKTGPGSRRAGAAGFGGARARPQRGADIEHTITVAFDTAAKGGTTSLRLSGGGGEGGGTSAGDQTLDVKIPKAIADGAKLRLRGRGRPSPTGGPSGDIILTVRVAAHPYFRRDGLDLAVDVPISIDEAVFGTTVEVPTLNGKATLKVPPRTPGGRKLRLRNAGLEDPRGHKGDLYAVMRIDVPTELTDEQTQALEALRGKLPDPRKDVKW